MSSESISLRAPAVVAVAAGLLSGCGEPMLLGSDVLWSSDHERGDLADWSLDARGGATPGAADGSAVEVTSERPRSGNYSVKLTSPASGGDAGPLLFRELSLPKAYYSAWYFLPSAHETTTYWTIAQIRTVPPDDEDEAPHGVNLNLRTLPGGEVVLFVFDNNEAYLQSPLADPPAIVPVGRWFQLELSYDSNGGRLGVWLEGRRVYEVDTSVRVAGEIGYFMPCNVANLLEPNPVVLYVDDAAVSLTRVEPDGVLEIE